MKIKLLIIYNKIWPYRIPIFELLNDEFDLTVGFSDPQYVDKQYSFKTQYLPEKKIGPFYIHEENLLKVCRDYDVVIGIFNVRCLSIMLLSLIYNRKFALIFWGIGVRASYKNKFDSNSKWDRIRIFFAKKVEAIIFYSSYPISKYSGAGVNKDKIFVANNTTKVSLSEYSDLRSKNNFIFVGTLYPEKGLQVLLEAYLVLSKKYPDCPKLEIIGEGPEYLNIRKFIIGHSLEEEIILHGSIYDSKILSGIYNRAIACISPNQAGLSVLTSMGNGTIFVTKKDAITGGEILNIENNVNGIIYEGENRELSEKMEWIMLNKEKSLKMCKNALDFYINNRMPEMMADSISESVYYSLGHKK